jgi:hypothetical protein
MKYQMMVKANLRQDPGNAIKNSEIIAQNQPFK